MMTASDAGTDCGVHICHIADEASTSAPFLRSFTRCGHATGQRVVWLVDSEGEGSLAQLAAEDIVGGDGAALEVAVAEDVYLDGGSFDPSRMLDRYRAEVAASQEAGYTGLRVVADTSWVARRPGDFEAFLAYENRVNELFRDGGFAAVCYYDASLLRSAWIQAVREAHPVHAHPGAEVALSVGVCHFGITEDGSLALAGELDCTNAAQLRGLLAEHGHPGGDLHIDASGLRFVGVAGVRALVLAACQLGRDGRIVVHGAPYSMRAVMDVSGLAGGTTGLVLAEER